MKKMKKITLLFLLIFAVATTHSQNYQISFAGSGTSTSVDSVKVENLTQCTDTILSGSDILHLIVAVGINEVNNDIDNTVTVYPNPMTGNCSIGFNAKSQGITTISLYDIFGKKILQAQELLSKGYHTYSLVGINSGVYFLKIESKKNSYTLRIVSINSTYGIPEIKHIGTTPCIDKKSLVLNLPTLPCRQAGGQAGTGEKKGVKSFIDMQYTTGDRLKLTGKSGNYRTIFMLVPAQDTTITFNFVACTDADSNHYAVVQIGTQMWMAENLKTTKYRDGTAIPNVTNDMEWLNTGAAYCDYNNTPDNSTTYGKLYNQYADFDAHNISPVGWHVPTDSEWTTLTTYLGGNSVAGGKLKENCSTHWNSPNTGATNESGFTALPGGSRDGFLYGTFAGIGGYGYWWTSTADVSPNAWYRAMSYYEATVTSGHHTNPHLNDGYSVRCVKD